MTGTSVIILAGQRPGIDPMCATAGVSTKADLPILGRPMMDYVLNALDECDVGRPYFVSGLGSRDDPRFLNTPSGQGPADSACLAFVHGVNCPAILTTCDHPLLTPDMVNIFIKGAVASEADFCVGLAERKVIQPAYPDVKRTYLKFADKAVSGCNLFYIANERGIKAIEFWRKAQQDRKRPLKLASRVGWGMLWSYATGRLTLESALEKAGKQLGLNAKAVMIPIAEAAIDVDKPSDKILVEDILRRRP